MTVLSKTVTTSVNDAFQRLTQVFKATGASTDVSWLSNAAQTFYLDDVSVVALDDVSLTVTPASAANCAEGTGLRVGGLSTLTQASTGLDVGAGSINFTATKRHAAADVAKFGVATPYELHWYEDANNYMYVYWSAANTLTLTFNATGGGDQTGNYDATGAWAAGAEKACRVIYSGSNCILYVAGTAVVTIAQPAVFATMTAAIYLGSDKDGINQSDTVYS